MRGHPLSRKTASSDGLDFRQGLAEPSKWPVKTSTHMHDSALAEGVNDHFLEANAFR